MGCYYLTFIQQNNVRVASPCDCIFNLIIIAIFLKSPVKYSVLVRARSPKPAIPAAARTTGCHQPNISATKAELLLPLVGRQKAMVSVFDLQLFSHLDWVCHIRI